MKINGLTSTLHLGSGLKKTTTAIARSLERLASGSRLASSPSNPAALALDTKLEAQVRGLRQGAQNLYDALGLAMTADSAISQQIDLVQEMRDLAVQASSSTISPTERDSLNTRVQQLLTEFRRISQETQWRGRSIIGGEASTTSLHTGSSGGTIEFDGFDASSSSIFVDQVGTGSYAAAKTWWGGNSPTDTQTHDLNNDGNLDIIYVEGATDVTVIRFGDGAGSFSERVTIKQDGGGNYAGIAVGDLNGDGSLDYIVDKAVYINDGAGGFTANSAVIQGAIAGSITKDALADIDGDGDLDLIHSSGPSGSIYYQLGDGTGNFSTITTVAATGGVIYNEPTSVDFNQDGKMDILFKPFSANNFHVFINTGGGFTETTYAVGGVNTALATGDLNNDGFTDIVVGVATPSIQVWMNDGDGTFTNTHTIAQFLSFAIQDVNLDGVLDYYNVSGSQISLALGLGGGFFANPITSAAFGSDPVGSFADFNSDGVLDFYGTNRATNSVGLQLGLSKTVSAESKVSLSTTAKAQATLDILDQAIANLQSEQGKVAALHSRLDFATASNLLTSERLEGAREQNRSVDYSLEIAELVRLQILQQAQVAISAQANVSMTMALQLLPTI